jgi:hypothetical protein
MCNKWHLLRSVLLLTMTPLMLANCQRRGADAHYWEGKRQIAELSQRLELLRYQFEHHSTADTQAMVRNGTANPHPHAPQRERLAREKSQLMADIDDIQQRILDMRNSDRRDRRMRSVGQKHDALVLADGRQFSQVTITGVDDVGVSIRHRDGTARLSYWDLSPELQDRYGLEETSALAAIDREERGRKLYESHVAAEMKTRADRAETAVQTASRKPGWQATGSMGTPVAYSRRSPLSQTSSLSSYRIGSSRSLGYSGSYRPRYRSVIYYRPLWPGHCASRSYPRNGVYCRPPILSPINTGCRRLPIP